MNWLRAHAKLLGGIVVGLMLIFGVMWQRCGIKGCPDVGKLKGYMPDEASTIYDFRGQEVGKLFLTRRFIVSLDSIPEYVPNAFIAIEDKRFYHHGGVDWRRVMGAFVTNVKSMGIQEGSSTITMQLARNAFPDQLPANKRTLFRKIAEARVARSIEKQYAKKEILALYLNQIYFGNGAYGIEAAAQEYYGKPASKLNLAEAATMAALPRAPSRMNPRSNKELAYQGRKEVLSRMVEQKLIDADEAEKAVNAKLKLRKGKEKLSYPAPYFIEALREVLESELGDAIYSKGYKIYTTLDARLQATLEQELANQLRAIESGAFGAYRHPTYAAALADTTDEDKGTKYLQGAGIFMDPRNGDVRALVGGRNFSDSEFNRATYARRQPGSAFKPFVYAAAIADGYTPTYRLMDQPIRMVLSRRQVWEPKNYDGTFSGVTTLRDALAFSKNVPTIRLAMEIGISRVIAMARQMGLSGRIPSVPSVVLGTAEVTPMDLLGAYAGFANLGERPMTPRYVTKVVDREGREVWAQESQMKEVLDPAVAFETISLMQDVVDRGTATSVRAVGFRDPAAGKTGTTNDGADTWFVGMTPQLIGTIWIGFDKRQTIVARASGGEMAAPIWGRVMVRSGQHSTGWVPPAGVEMRLVDANGNVVGDNCPAVGATRKEYFIQGTAPVATCYPTYDQYTWYDSLPDTSGYATTPVHDAGWWERMRARIFAKTEVQPLPAPSKDSVALRGQPVDTTKPKPPPVEYDSLVKPKPDTAKPDTTRVRR
ncbi:MAG TPA: PBP1A family penicillin-binding protein [Longimicrobiales bacterium]|nr:PBP1A family penicillin-binding protein [Longimicrobiales bacterium]